MALIVLAAICILACMFVLFVLFQWTRDTKRKTTTRAAVDDAAGGTSEKTRLQAADRASTEKRHAFPEGHAAPRAGRAVALAGLDATAANGLLTRKSSGVEVG